VREEREPGHVWPVWRRRSTPRARMAALVRGHRGRVWGVGDGFFHCGLLADAPTTAFAWRPARWLAGLLLFVLLLLTPREFEMAVGSRRTGLLTGRPLKKWADVKRDLSDCEIATYERNSGRQSAVVLRCSCFLLTPADGVLYQSSQSNAIGRSRPERN
jgi:hypothetical protein